MNNPTRIESEWIEVKYKKKMYYLAIYVDYEVDNSDYYKKKVTYAAGFKTKVRDLSTSEKMSLTASLAGDEVTTTKKFNKDVTGSHPEPEQEYIKERTVELDRGSTTRYLALRVSGDMKSTRFSGIPISIEVPITIEALSKPSISFTARRNSTTVTLALNVHARALLNVDNLVVKQQGSVISPTWNVTFPHTMTGLNETYTATVSGIDIMHDYTFDCSVDIGEFAGITDRSIAYAEKTALWKGEISVSVNDYPLPEMNPDGTAKIKVYCGTENSKVEIPNYGGWTIEYIMSGETIIGWRVPVSLPEQYVVNSSVAQTTARLFIQYDLTESQDGEPAEQKTAIFETSRNCGFTTGLANNIFIGGCKFPNYKSRVWYSYVNNPTYIPDTNYVEVGSNDTAVMGLVKVGDYLGIIKQSKTVDASVYLAYATSFDDETTFATKSCANGVGALGEFCFNVLKDETLFLSPDGVMAIEPSEDEQSRIKNRSYYVDGRLLEEPNLESAYSFVHDGMYYLCVNNKCYVLNGNVRNSWGNDRTNLVYECYYLENVPAKCMASFGGHLWFSDKNGNLCRFKDETDANPYCDDDVPVCAEWSTFADDDGSLHYYKTLQKKGTVVSLLPEEGTTADVYIKKDEEEPVLVGEKIIEAGKTLPSEFICKKKVKKYKRLQFIIRDDTSNPFGVNKIIKCYNYGNYAKR